MKKIILASVLLSFLFVAFNSVEVSAAAKPKTYKGKIVSLDDVLKAKKDLQLTKEQATELHTKGSPIVFMVGSKIYFVQNADGSFAFKKLADYAHNKTVAIIGKIKTVKGINLLIMDSIEKID
jgi:hypothetical protein